MAGEWKGHPIDYRRMIGQLMRFQSECRSQGLGVECEMATVLMSVIEHAQSDWANFSGQRFKAHLRKLQWALEHDTAEDDEPLRKQP